MRPDPDHVDQVQTSEGATQPRVETHLVSPTPPDSSSNADRGDRAELDEHEDTHNPLGKTAVISAVISVICGALGAWLYDGVLRPKPPEPPKAEVAATPSPAEPVQHKDSLGSNREAERVDKEIENLSSRVDKLQERFAALPKTAESAPDLSSIKDQLQAVLKDDETVASLPGRLAALADRVAALEGNQSPSRPEAESGTDQSKKTRPGSATSPSSSSERRTPAPASPAPRDGSDRPNRTESQTSAVLPPPSVAADFSRGAQLFHQGRYREAREIFTRLEELYPQDARVWYFAALTNGLVTRRWDGDTQLLVQRGLERERVGSPPPSQIDSTFSGLTLATGRDWLAGYRKSLTK